MVLAVGLGPGDASQNIHTWSLCVARAVSQNDGCVLRTSIEREGERENLADIRTFYYLV